MISTIPWMYPKGSRTRRQRHKPRRAKRLPGKISGKQLITLRCYFDCDGWIEIATDKTDASEASARRLAAYRPILVTDADYVSGTAIGDTFKWNDGIFTGIFSHYLQFPWESRYTEGSAKVGVSNMMINLRSLWGGSMIGANWDPRQSRFTFPDITSNIKELQGFKTPMVNVIKTRELQLFSYNIKLIEKSWCCPYILQGQNSTYAVAQKHLFQNFVLSGTASTLGITGADASANGVGQTYALKSILAQLARVTVRNLIIRLPSEPTEVGPSETELKFLGSLNGVLDGTDIWQELVWNIIKQDFMLVGDETYGPPSGYNRDLKARINPKYTVMREFFTTIALNHVMGGKNESHKMWFNHNFNVSYYTEHDIALANPVFATTLEVDGEDRAETTAISQGESGGKMTDVKVIEGTAGAKRARVEATSGITGDEQGQTDTSGTAMDVDATSTTRDGTTTGTTEMAADTASQVACLIPRANRIIWVRIPRMQRRDIELADLITGDKQFIFGLSQTGADSTTANLHLQALCQLCSTIKGTSCLKFLDPSINGTGEVVGPDDFGNTAPFGVDQEVPIDP